MSLSSSETKVKDEKAVWKQRFVREFVRYWINFAYLVVFFGVFAWYRRFILAEYRISYLNYGAAIIEALILAKVILLGDFLGLSRGFEKKPLVYPTLYKAVMFSGFVGLFAILEHMIGGLLHGKGVAGGLAELLREGKYELLARCLVTFFAFVPFFAFRELGTVLGEGKIRALFLGNRAAAESVPHA
jgi:hypothetical protein